ncbi:MAG: restriction endonuclease [Nitrososphaeria archaeon]|nr:restriction endonuclease [Nitrososphaeria archaeon]
MVQVRKADGRLEAFDRSKVVGTALHFGLDLEEAEAIADEVSRQVYDGIPTSKILSMIQELAAKSRPELEYVRDLREAISRMRSKPDFEEYIRFALRVVGYVVEPGRVLEGRCVSHEIDGIAFMGHEVLVVEVKHHVNQHTYTGLDTVLELWAAFEDLQEGHRLGLHEYAFTSAILACNTKISLHSERYARCKGIKYMGWKYPRAFALGDIVTKYRLYPITMLASLSEGQVASLGDRGIILLSQLVELDVGEVAKLINAEKSFVEKLIEAATAILSRPAR